MKFSDGQEEIDTQQQVRLSNLRNPSPTLLSVQSRFSDSVPVWPRNLLGIYDLSNESSVYLQNIADVFS